MKNIKHVFDIEIASIVGIEGAIIYENIVHWTIRNKANKINFHDGYYWTYNTQEALSEIFPYMRLGSLKSGIKKLKEANLIVTEQGYKSNKYDKTTFFRALSPVFTDDKESCCSEDKESCCSKHKKDVLLLYTNVNYNKAPNENKQTSLRSSQNAPLRSASSSCPTESKPKNQKEIDLLEWFDKTIWLSYRKRVDEKILKIGDNKRNLNKQKARKEFKILINKIIKKYKEATVEDIAELLERYFEEELKSYRPKNLINILDFDEIEYRIGELENGN